VTIEVSAKSRWRKKSLFFLSSRIVGTGSTVAQERRKIFQVLKEYGKWCGCAPSVRKVSTIFLQGASLVGIAVRRCSVV